MRKSSDWKTPILNTKTSARNTRQITITVLGLGFLAGLFSMQSASSQAALSEYRSFDGSGNHLTQADWGRSDTHLGRLAPSDYADGISAPAGPTKPNPRELSNAFSAESDIHYMDKRGSSFVWQWGQFLDHDIDLTPAHSPYESFDIPIAADDPDFAPTPFLGFRRSLYDPSTGSDATNPRHQINRITAYIDASSIYGSDATRADALRMLDGTGQLTMTTETDGHSYLMRNIAGLENDGGPSPAFFVSGDIRANEQLGLLSMHTLFNREHNYRATEIATADPLLTGEEIYQESRAWIGGLAQSITYREFLPILLGESAIPPYAGYQACNADIENAFSTAAYRFGHSAIPPTLLRLEADLSESPHGHLALRNAFFRPDRLIPEGGISPILRGLAYQPARRIDALVTDDLRNFLFGAPGAGGLDLAALNIQRGRDHGLAGYNATRSAYGLAPITSFDEVSSDPQIIAALSSNYADVDEIDLWVGGLVEDHMPDALLGETFQAMLVEQFTRLRDCDRFWYESYLPSETIDELHAMRLSDVIRRNTDIGDELPDDVFRVPDSGPDGLCLGDTVFFDLDNDGIFEPDAGEYGITGLELSLYKDLNANGTLDAGDPHLSSAISDEQGTYIFCNLTDGDYIVAISASHMEPGALLDGMSSSTGNDLLGTAPDPDDNVDNDDNGGMLGDGRCASQAISLQAFLEPGIALDQRPGNENPAFASSIDARNQARIQAAGSHENMSLDFGFARLEVPTSAQILDFQVELQAGGPIELRWHTSNEQNLAGFFISRALADGQGFEPIHSRIIISKGARNGAPYQFDDLDFAGRPLPAEGLTYRLEWVSDLGQRYLGAEARLEARSPLWRLMLPMLVKDF